MNVEICLGSSSHSHISRRSIPNGAAVAAHLYSPRVRSRIDTGLHPKSRITRARTYTAVAKKIIFMALCVDDASPFIKRANLALVHHLFRQIPILTLLIWLASKFASRSARRVLVVSLVLVPRWLLK